MVRNCMKSAAAFLALAVLFTGCGLRRHKYDNPITKDTQQPDKVLFDTAIDDIEHSRFERARLTLQTLMNTYDTSEYLAKAKLAVADSWYREGGAHGLAQAEAEYKDFKLFYPQMEEAAEAQAKVCDIHYRQMEKPDRDPMHSIRAEDECRTLLQEYPNSKFAPEIEQKLRNIQEVLAESEYRVGMLYFKKGSNAAAANRFQGLTDQFPLYSGADEALWQEGEAYQRMGDRFENQQASAYTKIVKDYPLSEHVEEARQRLEAMKRPVPEADPVAYARMKYELENHEKPGMFGHAFGIFRQHPDTSMAAKSGTPQMAGLRPTIPASVPAAAAGTLGVTDVTAATGSAAQLDQSPDARLNQGAAAAPGNTAVTAEQPPQNAVMELLNHGSEQQLQRVRGVNKSLARKIIGARPYATVEELKRAGASDKLIDELRKAGGVSAAPAPAPASGEAQKK